MGLDDFMDVEPSSTDNTTEDVEKSNNQEESIVDNNYGPIGYESLEEYEDTVDKSIKLEGGLFKYNLPIFPVIENTDTYSTSTRYREENMKRNLSCINVDKHILSDVPRELIMLDTGETDKNKCLEVLTERFGEEAKPDTEVYVYFFAKIREIAKFAIGDSLTDSWSLKDKDHILKAIYDESYTQRFRKSDEVDSKYKHIDHIEPW